MPRVAEKIKQPSFLEQRVAAVEAGIGSALEIAVNGGDHAYTNCVAPDAASGQTQLIENLKDAVETFSESFAMRLTSIETKQAELQQATWQLQEAINGLARDRQNDAHAV